MQNLEVVYETLDGGRTWHSVVSDWTYDNDATTVAPSPDNGIAWVRTTASEPGLLRPATGTQPYWEVGWDVQESGPETGQLLGSGRSYDQFDTIPLFGVFFSDVRHGWVCGEEAVWATSNAGAAWHVELTYPLNEQPYHSEQVFCRAGNRILLATTVWEGQNQGAVVVWSRARP